MVHALLLFLLGILYWAGGRNQPTSAQEVSGQLVDDVTSAEERDQAGSPFTTIQSLEPPSLPSEVDPRSEDYRVVAVETTEFDRAIPRIELPTAPDGASGSAAKGREGMLNVGGAGPTVPFTGRSGAAKAKLLIREGGTKESEKAVEIGLDWISRHQNPDGSWSLDVRNRCTAVPCPGEAAQISDSGATGLALLPFLGAGHTHRDKGRYRGTIERGLIWLIRTQRPDGAIDPGGSMHTHMYAHAIATMALAEAYGLTKDPSLKEPTRLAVQYITRAQHPDGGWRYEPLQPGDTSVLGWQLFALRSANMSGIPVPRPTISRTKRFLDLVAADRSKTIYKYMASWAPSNTMTAEALVARQLLGWPQDFPALRKGAAYISSDLNNDSSRNIYYWYYATQLLHNVGGPDWERWNPKMRETLISMQTTGNGCGRGSWDPNDPVPDRWGRNAGRLFQTSLSILTLEVYYRYLPLYKDKGGQIDGGKDEENAPEKVESATVKDQPKSTPATKTAIAPIGEK
jgi:hypothetical protein